MALTQAQRIQISGEQLDLPLKVEASEDAQDQIGGVKDDLLAQDDSLKIFFDKDNGNVNAYQTEHRWIDGTTYTTVTNAELIESAKREPGNKFFPTDGSWTKFQPKLHASAEGDPNTNSSNNEIENTSLLSDSFDFLVNGQLSAVVNTTLTAPYTIGSGTMLVASALITVGNYIIVQQAAVSGLFLVLSKVTTTLTVQEIVTPNGALTAGATVIENIIGFTNTERNTLVSALYQNVLTGLSTDGITKVGNWETTLDNQQTQLNANTDSRSPQATQITSAKNDITNAKSIIDVWQALPNTGTLGTDSKFTDNNLLALTNEISARLAFTATRETQITTALGNVSQSGSGTFSGSGLYFSRFTQINLRINLAGGPLTEYYEKDMAEQALDQIVTVANDQLDLYESELRTEALDQNAAGTNTVVVASATGFSNGNTVFVMADTLTELTGTITGISGLNITLSFTVPNTYTKDKRARIYKQL